MLSEGVLDQRLEISELFVCLSSYFTRKRITEVDGIGKRRQSASV